MPTNEIKPFATGGGANVIGQAAYEALTTLLANGFSGGIAESAKLNKVWRQSSFMAAVLAQFIVDNSGLDVLDNGDVAALATKLKTAMQGAIPDATTSVKGLMVLATTAEVQAGTDATKAVTAASLRACTALTTRIGVVQLATTAEATAGTDTTKAVTPAGVAAALAANPSSVGKHQIPVNAGAMYGRITGAPEPSAYETSTNKDNLRTWNFDPVTKEYVQFAVSMPKSWNLGTLTAQIIWSHGVTATNFGVGWAIQAVAMGDGDAGDAAFGTAVQVNDTGGTTDAIYMTAESGAITVAGTPQAGDMVLFQVYRVADDAVNDTLAVDARLIGLRLFYTTNAATDA